MEYKPYFKRKGEEEMKYEEIIKLLDAGYTREEILEMKEEPENMNNNSDNETDPGEKMNNNSDSDMSDLVKEMRDAFSEMRKEFTAMNIMASRQPEEKTPEDIIANIINPTRKKKGE